MSPRCLFTDKCPKSQPRTGHGQDTRTRACVSRLPLYKSQPRTPGVFLPVLYTGRRSRSFVPSRHVGKSARRTTTGPVETHRGGRRLTRDRAYLVSVFLVGSPAVPRASRAHAFQPGGARDSHGGRTACAHQHNGTYLHMRCTLGCSKRCPVTGRDSAAASCVHSTRHSTQ